jgi:urocanate hydratase
MSGKTNGDVKAPIFCALFFFFVVMWAGYLSRSILDSIRAQEANRTVSIQRGDIAVFYTDGQAPETLIIDESLSRKFSEGSPIHVIGYM